MIFSSKNTTKELQESWHPSQVQKRYGGEAEDVTRFWPPYYPSSEFGVDSNKLKPRNEYDASLMVDDPVTLPNDFYDSKKAIGVTSRIDQVDLNQIKLSTESELHRNRNDIELRDEQIKIVEKTKRKDREWCCIIF